MVSHLTASVHSQVTDEWGNDTVELRVVNTVEQQQASKGAVTVKAPTIPDVSATQAEAQETLRENSWGIVLIYFESPDGGHYRVAPTDDADFIKQTIQEGMVRIGWIGLTDAPKGIKFDFALNDSFPLNGEVAKRFLVNARDWVEKECKRQCTERGIAPPIAHDMQFSDKFVAAQNAATQKSRSTGLTFLIVLGLVILIGVIIYKSLESSSGSSASKISVPAVIQEKDQLDTIIGRCGKPDVDNSTEHNNPRPSSPTRWLVYKQAHLKITFAPKNDGGMPPTPKWRLVRMTDSRTKQPVAPQEAFKRMPCLSAP